MHYVKKKLKSIIIFVCSGTIIHVNDEAFGLSHNFGNIMKKKWEGDIKIFWKRSYVWFRHGVEKRLIGLLIYNSK